MALDEEEKVATQNPKIYSNIVKLRIVALQKMKLEDWKTLVLEDFAQRHGFPEPAVSTVSKALPSLNTGLTAAQELAILPHMVTSTTGLEKYGYITSAPTTLEIAQTRESLEAAKGWEECDRCTTRFQVFPGRRASDGALTTGGKCMYHPSRPQRPQKAKTDAITGGKAAFYPCCNETVGATVGCTEAATHVFKASEAKRLADVLQFEKTPDADLADVPEKGEKRKGKTPVAFDCEMGYTTRGMELIRLTATAWPSGATLLDILVRPIGEVLDLNSRFSGVWPQHFADAVPDNSTTAIPELPSNSDQDQPAKILPVVPSPSAARSLLFTLLNPSTPLIGHALDNDLNATRIIHPTIVDTVLLFKHPRGLPMRFGLKMLSKKYLEWEIQMGGERGHDSAEDARASGELVRWKVREKWMAMKTKGWTFKDGELVQEVADKLKEG